MSSNNYTFQGKEKSVSMILLIAGLVLAALGIFMSLGQPARIWASLLYNNYFFLTVALASVFFIAAHTVGWGGWYIVLKRVSEAMMMYVPIGAILMIPILFFGMKSVFHWTDPSLYEVGGHHYDKLIAGKQAFLNVPFFWIRTLLYLGLWSLFAFLLRRNSLAMDKGYSLGLYKRSKFLSALFLIVFAVTSSTASWDFLMSIQPHWYSTLFGWYHFISFFVASIAMTVMICAFLKSLGLLPYMTSEHFHDLGKFMFAFSIAWAYLFFSQFMLIWYANIPEEGMFFKERFENYPVIMWSLILINFVTPFFILMTRDAKRAIPLMVVVAALLFFGHWLDFFQMAVPGALKEAAHAAGHHGPYAAGPGILELGLMLAYLGLFLFITFTNLAKAPMHVDNHPYFKESAVHHT